MNRPIKYKIISVKINKHLINDEILIQKIVNMSKPPRKHPDNLKHNNSKYATVTYVDQKFNELNDKLNKKIADTNKATIAYVDKRFNELKIDTDIKFNNINLQLKQIIEMINNKL